ncbi:MAG TPA: TonB-dependent receptor [Allosphingosinicella sp.]|nr:TonB-dependent receptor [Allosphingosinicella sp.]
MAKGSRSSAQNHAAEFRHEEGARERSKAATVSVCVLAAGLFGSFATEALAQTAGDNAGELQEIVVTAQKRSTNLQKTPISVTALNGEDLRKSQINLLPDIAQRVPNFKMGDFGGYTQITVRGIGISNFTPTAESAVATNANEVYISRTLAIGGGLYDVSAIEVLRGPQGTLYGRNATAGAVNITTTRPTNDLSGFVRATYGNYDDIRVEGAVGGGIVKDKILARVAGFREKRDGYGKNIITGNDIDDKDAYGVRGTLVLTPTSNLKATLIGEYYHDKNNGGAIHYLGAAGLTGIPGALGSPPFFIVLGGVTPSNPYDIANAIDPEFRLRTSSAIGIVEWSQGPFSLKSITGYRDQNADAAQDISAGQFLGGVSINGEEAHQFSQELQAHYDTSRVHLTGGLFYFKEHDDYTPATVYVSNLYLNFIGVPAPVPGFTRLADIGGLLKTTAKAAFAEGTVNVTDKLSFTAGIRYSHERKHLFQRNAISFTEPFTGDITPPPAVSIPPKTFNATTPKLGIQYQATPDTLLYATFTKGFKSGGFDPGTDPAFVALGFQPEKVTDYEAGIKTMLLDRRLRINLSGFYYDYTDLQVQQTRGFNTIVTTNAASARLYGAELEVSALVTQELMLEGNASWLHARYRKYQGSDSALPFAPVVVFDGNRLNNAPDFRAYLSASYRFDLPSGNVVLKAEGEYSTKYYFSPLNIRLMSQPAYAKANAYLTYTNNAGWSVSGFIRNITDKATVVAAQVISPLFGSPAVGAYAPPRTYGVALGYNF